MQQTFIKDNKLYYSIENKKAPNPIIKPNKVVVWAKDLIDNIMKLWG